MEENIRSKKKARPASHFSDVNQERYGGQGTGQVSNKERPFCEKHIEQVDID